MSQWCGRAARAWMVLAMAGAPALADDGDDVVPGQVAVKLAPGASLAAFTLKYGVVALESIDSRRTHLIGVPVGDEEEFVDLVVLDPMVEKAEPNFTGRDVIPDPAGQSIFVAGTIEDYQNQSAIALLGSDRAHPLSTGAGVTIAVIDSGVDAGHPSLAGSLLAGWNFIENNANVADVGDGLDNDDDGLTDEMVGHGTLVAGLIVRVAPDVKVVPLRVLDSDGYTTTFTMVEAMYFAMDAGVRVLNISLGTTQETFVIEEAMDEARSLGVLVVAAVGNDDTSSPVRYPAASMGETTLAIAALGDSNVKAHFSNFGPHVTASAPGTLITSTVPGGLFGLTEGTSFSAPLATGTAALVWSRYPAMTPSEVVAQITRRARPVDTFNPNHAGQLGAGRIHALTAVKLP